MIQLHCDVKQLKIGKTMSVLQSFLWNYVKYANMEGFRRDSHKYQLNIIENTSKHHCMCCHSFHWIARFCSAVAISNLKS